MLERDLASGEAGQLSLAVQGGHAHLKRTGCTGVLDIRSVETTTFTDLTMLSANSLDCASDSGLAFPLNDAALARADPDLDLDLVRLVERAALTMDLCGLCGIFRVVLQIRSMNPGTQKEFRIFR